MNLPRFTLLLIATITLAPFARAEDLKWYRGNTHAHTVLCGHADSDPAAVVRWYHDRGYNFLCLSEHNQFIDPAKVAMPPNVRKDFLLIPGEEITGTNVHMTGLNMTRIVNHLIKGPNGKVIQAYTDMARAQGGTPIINHPNFRWALKISDIRPTKNCFHFELWNGHQAVNNLGDETRPSTEKMWDDLLTDGMLIYGVASDDLHQLKTLGLDLSNPGRGWVMVHASELTPAAITQSMERGDFYASNGVLLKSIERKDRTLSVSVDEAATSTELGKHWVTGDPVPSGTSADSGFLIEFVGPSGNVLSSKTGTSADYTADASLPFFRARVSVVREFEGQLRRFHAWTQPIFQDDRAKAIPKQ